MQVQVKVRRVPTMFGDLVRSAMCGLVLIAVWKATSFAGYATGLWAEHVSDYWLAFMAGMSAAFIALRLDRGGWTTL